MTKIKQFQVKHDEIWILTEEGNLFVSDVNTAQPTYYPFPFGPELVKKAPPKPANKSDNIGDERGDEK